MKVGKKTPLTEAHFDEFYKLLPARGDGANSWTVNFAERLEKAMDAARPHREKAAELDAQAKELEATLREKRKAKATNEAKLAALEDQWKTVERAARESLAKAVAIEDAAYDLKAVNPNRVDVEDKRTPMQLLDFIADKGREADGALGKLRELVGDAKSQ